MDEQDLPIPGSVVEPEAPVAPEVEPEVEPEAPEAAPEAPVASIDVSAVPGTQLDRHPSEGLEPQPDAPQPVPATAEPDKDAVSLNTHVDKVTAELEASADHLDSYPAPVSGLSGEIRALAQKIKNALRI